MMFEYIFDEDAQFEEYTEEVRMKVEKKLGVKLPKAYIDLMKVHNGGYLDYSHLHSAKVLDGIVEITQISGIDFEEGIIESPYYIEEWNMEEGLVIFSGDGNYWLAFDYRKHTGDSPSIVYMEDTDEPAVKIADNFELFLKKLQLPQEGDFEEEEETIYTKAQFEQLMKNGQDGEAIYESIQQFMEQPCDFTWYVSNMLHILHRPDMEAWYRTVGESVLFKMRKDRLSSWPVDLLTELVTIITSEPVDEDNDQWLAIRAGHIIEKKLQVDGKNTFDYIFDVEALFEPFTADVLRQVEASLGVKLPSSYISLMAIQNGGCLVYDGFESEDVPDGYIQIMELQGIDLEDGIIETKDFIKHWDLEEGLIVLCNDGNGTLALDYRQKDMIEPSVIYLEDEEDARPVQIAKNFEDFLKQLKHPDEEE